MVILSTETTTDNIPIIDTCNPREFTTIPVIDFHHPDAKNLIVEACQEFGFFKVVNHGVSVDLITDMENIAINFFKQNPLEIKEKEGPLSPLGYGKKKIGPNGDVGRIEYLLLKTTYEFMSEISPSIIPDNPRVFSSVAWKYTKAVKKMVCKVLEMAAEGLGITKKNELSKLVRNKKSDCMLRVNHYPPCPDLNKVVPGQNLMGFGEHTDPQIMSAVRSNNTSGLQISLKNGEWVSVPSDRTSFFIIVGDTLQVMTNGRFRSVRHRVFSDTLNSRVSMVFFGGPPQNHKIAALPSIMKEGEEAIYKDFTWSEFKQSAYKSLNWLITGSQCLSKTKSNNQLGSRCKET